MIQRQTNRMDRGCRPLGGVLASILLCATMTQGLARQRAAASGQSSTVVQHVAPDGRSGYGYRRPSATPCLTTAQRAEIKATIATNRRQLPGPATGIGPQLDLRFRWPLRVVGAAADEFGVHGISNFVDQDPAFPDELLDYNCGARTYDLANGYNHRGIDFFTWPLAWTWMDQNAVQVVAAAPGIIVARSDGNFDESCGFGGTWNAVYVEHADGTVAWYGHLKAGSLTSKTVGEGVQIGEYLGVVGSSGSSTGPHLHFEVYDALNNLVDPFAGPCNGLPRRVRWLRQRPYYDSAINKLVVGVAPVEFPACPGRAVLNEASVIPTGATAYFTVFYRDQLLGQTAQYRIRTPSGSVFRSWNHSSPAAHYSASYWNWSYFISAGVEQGLWSFEAIFEGQSYVQYFTVGS